MKLRGKIRLLLVLHLTQDYAMAAKNLLIHSANPQFRMVVIIVFSHAVRPSLFKSSKTKQLKIMVATYWRDCGSGRVDH